MGKYHGTICLLFYWFGLVCFANKNKNVSCQTADSKPVKQEVNSTVIFPPLVFPAISVKLHMAKTSLLLLLAFFAANF
jgi:hypothetical protein